MRILLSAVLSELRTLHGLAPDGDVPRQMISRRLTELLRRDSSCDDRPAPSTAHPPGLQASTPSHGAADSLP